MAEEILDKKTSELESLTLAEAIEANAVVPVAIPNLGNGNVALEDLAGQDGANGKSAYEVAVDNGFEGTEAQWLASLKGDKGDKGDTGATGPQGPAGTGVQEVFIVEYGVTSYADTLAAYNAGKIIFGKRSDLIYVMTEYADVTDPTDPEVVTGHIFWFASFEAVNPDVKISRFGLSSENQWQSPAVKELFKYDDRPNLVRGSLEALNLINDPLTWMPDGTGVIGHIYLKYSPLFRAPNVSATGVNSVTVTNNKHTILTDVASATLTIRSELESYATGGQEAANFVVEVTPSVDCTVTIETRPNSQAVPAWTALKYSADAGNTLTAGKTYQITCVGSCWTMAEFVVPVTPSA